MSLKEQTPRTSEVIAIYVAPRLDELGSVVELTNGAATDNIKDGNAWYW